jgi:hypothetical protein
MSYKATPSDPKDRSSTPASLQHIPDEEQERAAMMLARKLPLEFLEGVYILMQNKQNPWWVPVHFSHGIKVRNLLRKEGFATWSDMTLDSLRHPLLEKAAHLVMETPKISRQQAQEIALKLIGYTPLWINVYFGAPADLNMYGAPKELCWVVVVPVDNQPKLGAPVGYTAFR